MSSVITGSFSSPTVMALSQGNAAIDLKNSQVTDINAKKQNEASKETPADVDTPKEQGVISKAQLEGAVESINQFVNAQVRTLNFSVDEASGKAVVKVIDFETKDVIRQIPGEEVLRMASAIKQLQDDLGVATGLLIDNKV